MEQVASLVYLPFPTAFHTLLRLLAMIDRAYPFSDTEEKLNITGMT